MMDMMKAAIIPALLIAALSGCASTTTDVKANGSNRGAGGSATVSTGIKF